MPVTHRLVPEPPRVDAVEALASAAGGRVGLTGVLSDLRRRARPAYAPGTLARRAFTWDRQDAMDAEWWPQGITTSADAGAGRGADAADVDTFAGRRVVLTTAYARPAGGPSRGSRISVVDVTDERRIRYEHVLLVAPRLHEDGSLGLDPVTIHAGGTVWHGPWLHVAATGRGLCQFHLDDVMRVEEVAHRDRLGVLPWGGLAAYGFRYVLPLHTVTAAWTAPGARRLRYSFVSLDRGEPGPGLLAGEYDVEGRSTRLVRYDLDAATAQIALDPAGRAEARSVGSTGVPRMQGAVRVGDRIYATASDGRRRRGTLWTGTLPDLRPRPRSLPAGPEDLCWWPQRDELWSLTEHPGRRLVFSLDRGRLG